MVVVAWLEIIDQVALKHVKHEVDFGKQAHMTHPVPV